MEKIEYINFQQQMQSPSIKQTSKSAQFTRKKIQNYSYGLTDIIGKGYSSQVYKGRDQISNCSVAIKVIDLKLLKNQINRVLLESQIQILKELKNKENILTLHDVYTTKNNTYIITELCDSDMNKVVKDKITENQAYAYMQQLINGYAYLYQAEVVHRDLKPANLLVTKDKLLKIADFGFGIKHSLLSKPSKYNVGSPLYMAPQSLKKNQYSFKTDLWSIGIIFFQMLTGQTPWKAKSQKQLIKKIQSQAISKVLQKRNFSKMTNQFLTKILCFDKNQRLTPEQLINYSFKLKAQSNILCQRTLNTTLQRSNRFQSANNNITNFMSPKNIFNQSIEKTFFQKQRSQKNIISINNSSNNLTLKSRKQTQTMKQINENANPFNTDKKTVVNPEILKSQDKKQISKVLLSMVHFCRFLFKLIMRIRQSQSSGILKQIGYFQVQQVYSSYTLTIKHIINILLSFSTKNILNLALYDLYKQTSDYQKLMKITHQYQQRYSQQLKQFWNGSSEESFTQKYTHRLLTTMSGYTDDIVNGMDQPDKQVGKISKDVIIIDYLMTAKQLFEIFENNQHDYFNFAKKSRIQDIVEGTTTDITYALYQKIIQKANATVFSPQSPRNMKKPFRNNNILTDCSSSFKSTGSSFGSFRINSSIFNR